MRPNNAEIEIILGRIDAVLADNIDQINKRDRMAPVTGNLSETIRKRIEAARAKASAANERIAKAFDSIENAAAMAERQAADAEKEAAEIQAALGLASNGPPA